MNDIKEQVIATNIANVDAFTTLTNQVFTGVEKLVELNLATTKSLLAESMCLANAVLGAKDVQELMTLQSKFLQPLADKSAAYAEQVKTIVTDSSAEFKKSFDAKAAEAQKVLTSAVENLTKNAPTSSEVAVAAFKSALTAGHHAVESAQVHVRHAVETAQANFTAAANDVVDVTAKVSKNR